MKKKSRTGPSSQEDQDPFAPSNDPYRNNAQPPTPPHQAGTPTRRTALLAGFAAPAFAWATGCAARRLACPPKVESPQECQHRFCRYFRGA